MEIKTIEEIIDIVYERNNGGKDRMTSYAHGETLSPIYFGILAREVAKEYASQAVRLAIEAAANEVAYPEKDSILSLADSIIGKLK